MATDHEHDSQAAADEDFLSRWSKRKRAAREAGDHEPASPSSPADPADEPDRARDAAPLTDADMPAVDSLDERSDVSGFFSSGVSEQLRRQALRQVFRQPHYHVRDGLDDYDGDYRHFEPLGDDVMTADRRLREERWARRAEEWLEGDEARSAETAENDPENSNENDDTAAGDSESGNELS